MPRAKKTPMPKTCMHCSAVFSTTDSRRLFCSRACKDAARNHSNATVEALHDEGPIFRYDQKARRKEERRTTQNWIYETVFSTPKEFRADVLMALLVFAATSYNSGIPGATRYRDILTYPTAQRSNRFTAKDKGTAHLHYRGLPMTYPVTIASMANHVCRFHLGISSSEFIVEIRRDGVTMADMQAVFDELTDTTKPEPVIQGCDIEEPANAAPEELTAGEIAHASVVLADPFGAARQAHEIGTVRLPANDRPSASGSTEFEHARLLADQAVEAAQTRVAARMAAEAGALDAANARFLSLIAAE